MHGPEIIIITMYHCHVPYQHVDAEEQMESSRFLNFSLDLYDLPSIV